MLCESSYYAMWKAGMSRKFKTHHLLRFRKESDMTEAMVLIFYDKSMHVILKYHNYGILSQPRASPSKLG